MEERPGEFLLRDVDLGHAPLPHSAKEREIMGMPDPAVAPLEIDLPAFFRDVLDG